jgi:hypothetical protein
MYAVLEYGIENMDTDVIHHDVIITEWSGWSFVMQGRFQAILVDCEIERLGKVILFCGGIFLAKCGK